MTDPPFCCLHLLNLGLANPQSHFTVPTVTLSSGKVMPSMAWGNYSRKLIFSLSLSSTVPLAHADLMPVPRRSGRPRQDRIRDRAHRHQGRLPAPRHCPGKLLSLKDPRWALADAASASQGYNNQKETGEFLRTHDAGKKLFLTTKLSTPNGSPTTGPMPLSEIKPKILATIQELGRQPDVLIVHNPFVTESITELFELLNEMKRSGELTSTIGVVSPSHRETPRRTSR